MMSCFVKDRTRSCRQSLIKLVDDRLYINCEHSPTSTNSRPTTRSKTRQLYPIGTIIRKRFDQTWYEGEITKHDPGSDYYHIKYTDGDAEEMTY